MQAAPTLEELLGSAQRSALHLEMRDLYIPSDPRYVAWCEGKRIDPADRPAWWRPWLDLTLATARRGVAVHRARIISEPLSDYIRFEHSITYQNLAGGEVVRWLPRQRASDIALPGNDFWLIDDRLVRWGFFGGEGQLVGHEATDDPAAIKLCASAFEAVWERAVPHEEYEPA